MAGAQRSHARIVPGRANPYRLRLYHSLWQEPVDGDQTRPDKGMLCAHIPRLGADLAAIAATLVSLIGVHLQQAEGVTSGTYLIALPHAATGQRHHFLPTTASAPSLTRH